jgi:hypothetical protein
MGDVISIGIVFIGHEIVNYKESLM